MNFSSAILSKSLYHFGNQLQMSGMQCVKVLFIFHSLRSETIEPGQMIPAIEKTHENNFEVREGRNIKSFQPLSPARG